MGFPDISKQKISKCLIPCPRPDPCAETFATECPQYSHFVPVTDICIMFGNK